MSDNSFKTISLVISLTLFCGVGLLAQGLPEYGIRRLQTAPELSYGSFPQQAIIFDDELLIQGVGFDTNHIFTVGSFFSIYDGNQLKTLEFDTVKIKTSNDFFPGSALVVPNGVLSIRNTNYDPIDTNYFFSGAASILEYVSFLDSQLVVRQIDTLWLTAHDVEEQTGFLTTGIKVLDGNRSDTIRYVFNCGFRTIRTAIVEIRSYVTDSIVGYRKVKTVLINEDIQPNDFQIGVWSFGDTLGRAQLILDGGVVRMIFRYFNLHTGNPISSPVLVKPQASGIARVISNERAGLGFVTESNIDWDAPRYRRTTIEVTAFDLRTGEVKWENAYISRSDWFTSPDWEFTRVDSSGRVALTAYPSVKVYDYSTGHRDHQLEIKAANAITGDSLWATYLQLDSFATRYYDMAPMDIAIKPNGEGYVVVGWISESKLDPYRDLRYSYTALFFLDSLGCLAPGCRDASSTKRPTLGYEISLAPNPVRAGGELSVSFPASVSEVRYAITNAHGQRLRFSESERVTGGRLHVPVDILSSGMYYLTVWPADSGNAMLTRGFVVE